VVAEAATPPPTAIRLNLIVEGPPLARPELQESPIKYFIYGGKYLLRLLALLCSSFWFLLLN